eukprot:CAMPEP_0167826030 /NCGR_PEP_ID=MMETSP0112_2-20121227/9749_1 /TAXON_ID=91324 /ORGANISM="Lotharella globosa, Strain CCCM811" /LENGTH=180 /DNA_ID=CAMNT_0007728311 /DNA_START=265 /DNA_END=804 /DNA_ORIENTATION=-
MPLSVENTTPSAAPNQRVVKVRAVLHAAEMIVGRTHKRPQDPSFNLELPTLNEARSDMVLASSIQLAPRGHKRNEPANGGGDAHGRRELRQRHIFSDVAKGLINPSSSSQDVQHLPKRQRHDAYESTTSTPPLALESRTSSNSPIVGNRTIQPQKPNKRKLRDNRSPLSFQAHALGVAPW